MKKSVLSISFCALLLMFFSCSPGEENPAKSPEASKKKKETVSSKKGAKKSSAVRSRAQQIGDYARNKGYSTKYCFLVNMSIASGRNRFFVYDLEKDAIVQSGLVAHGSCNENFLSRPRFSNTPECGCSSLGKYKIGAFYRGQYGKSFRLHGLDKSNSNAFKRAVVLHGYDCVPDKEIYPMVLCNSLGCPMVSPRFFDRLSRIIQQSGKPILLWVYR